jgi:hypothetical protein
MRRAARSRDDDFEAARFRTFGKGIKPLGRAMRRNDLRLKRHAEFRQNVGGVFHRRPVRLAAHDDADERLGFAHRSLPMT